MDWYQVKLKGGMEFNCALKPEQYTNVVSAIANGEINVFLNCIVFKGLSKIPTRITGAKDTQVMNYALKMEVVGLPIEVSKSDSIDIMLDMKGKVSFHDNNISKLFAELIEKLSDNASDSQDKQKNTIKQ